MPNSGLKSIPSILRSLNEFRRRNQLNCIYAPSNHFHGGNLRNKPQKKRLPRPCPHKRIRNQRREPIPFLDHLKQCENPDDYLTIFRDFSEMGYKHDYPSYASLVFKLARAKRFEDVDVVLEFLKTRDIKCQEALFIGLIRHYGKTGMIDKAVEVFDEMGKALNCVRTVQSFNTILNVLVDGDRIPQAVELFKNGRRMGFRLNSISYNNVIKMWLQKDDWENARKVFDEMLERDLEPTVVTYNCQIGYLCRRGDLTEAKRIFNDMRGKGRNANEVTYALLMEGLCASGKFKEAKKMMFDMEYHGCKVHLMNYGVLMTDLAKRGLVDEAKALLLEMKKRRMKPDVVIYNILISCLCKEGNASEAYKILVDMQLNGCEPNAATYRMAVDGFCRVGDFSQGLKVLNAMMHCKHLPRIETFFRLSVGLIRSGKHDEAWFVLEVMEKKKMVLDLDSWEILVGECCMGASVSECFDDVTCSRQCSFDSVSV